MTVGELQDLLVAIQSRHGLTDDQWERIPLYIIDRIAANLKESQVHYTLSLSDDGTRDSLSLWTSTG